MRENILPCFLAFLVGSAFGGFVTWVVTVEEEPVEIDMPGHREPKVVETFTERVVYRDNEETLQDLQRARDEIDRLKAANHRRLDELILALRKNQLLDVPELADERLGLDFPHQVIITAAITRLTAPTSAVDLMNEAEAHRRSKIITKLLDSLVGEDHRKVIQENLWAEARRYGNNAVAFSARDPFRQRLHGYLNYPCNPKEKIR